MKRQRELEHRSSGWLRCLRPREEALLRLFCFPYAGGGGAAYRAWPARLPEAVEVWTVQLPGREERLAEAPFTELRALLAALTPSLLPALDLPFVFFGHSMGALISFELTRHLRRHAGLRPSHLLVSARRAPHLPAARAPIHALPEKLFKEEILRLTGTPPVVFADEELARIFLPLLRADIALCETYEYEEEDALCVPVAAFGGTRDEGVEPRHLEAWCELTTAPCSVHLFEGGHFYLREAQAPLLEKVSSLLARTANAVRLRGSGMIFEL
ncbi:MAG TPA: alpha/beta fold hydrolase [Pyrinomonadaceae bacterium]|nr:alpha/beta fold hydrolase [Pyrinomonadaceae bacterium]